jgi:hypothetical protein
MPRCSVWIGMWLTAAEALLRILATVYVLWRLRKIEQMIKGQ